MNHALYVTFNDDTMTEILGLLRDVSESDGFAFLDGSKRLATGRAFPAGIDRILKFQVVIDDRLTVWCVQHDEKSPEPRGARTVELPSLSGSESSGILVMLMSLDNTGPDVRRAVLAGTRSLEGSKFVGIRQVTLAGDKVIKRDLDAFPLWARSYEIGTYKPIFAGRDGRKRNELAKIESERRKDYVLYGE